MRLLSGKAYRKDIGENKFLDVAIYPGKWTTEVDMSLWEEGNPSSLANETRTYLNVDKFFPLKTAKKIGALLLNKQSQKVAGVYIITK